MFIFSRIDFSKVSHEYINTLYIGYTNVLPTSSVHKKNYIIKYVIKSK